ncbi:MAG: transposase [Planctomycetaceae bacterium]|jgi:transposase|nr:transposase [Planctomycetaceae bacterium]
MKRLIKRRRCRVLYLPPYSPDFNPLELSFPKVKGGASQTLRDMNK